MSKRHGDRDRWEIYFLTLMLAFRPIFFISGLIMSIYALAALFVYPAVGILALCLALFLFLMVTSDRVPLLVARAFSWMITVGRR